MALEPWVLWVALVVLLWVYAWWPKQLLSADGCIGWPVWGQLDWDAGPSFNGLLQPSRLYSSLGSAFPTVSRGALRPLRSCALISLNSCWSPRQAQLDPVWGQKANNHYFLMGGTLKNSQEFRDSAEVVAGVVWLASLRSRQHPWARGSRGEGGRMLWHHCLIDGAKGTGPPCEGRLRGEVEGLPEPFGSTGTASSLSPPPPVPDHFSELSGGQAWMNSRDPGSQMMSSTKASFPGQSRTESGCECGGEWRGTRTASLTSMKEAQGSFCLLVQIHVQCWISFSIPNDLYLSFERQDAHHLR